MSIRKEDVDVAEDQGDQRGMRDCFSEISLIAVQRNFVHSAKLLSLIAANTNRNPKDLRVIILGGIMRGEGMRRRGGGGGGV